MNHDSDAHLARRLATEAGGVLLALRAAPQWRGADPAALRGAADEAAQRYLDAELSVARPADVVRSEEAADDPRRSTADRVWIIDPLDGTREFAEGRDDWAVHVALWCRGELVAGAVALPALRRTLGTDRRPAPPADQRDSADRPGRRRIAVSRSRAPAVAEAAAAALDAELVPMGSAGYKVSAVVLGEVDAYVHAGGQYEWDSAAPVAVARAAGFHASRLDGSALVYNRPDPYLPDLIVCRPELAAALLSAVRSSSEVSR